jgi:O-antigen/teichoic acid export membrane protein
MSVAEKAEAEAPDTGAAPAIAEERLSTEDVRQRAVGGAAIDVVRGLGSRFLGFFGTLVLAHFVTPSELGTVALGVTFMTFGNFLADGGVGATLIRRVKPVERTELRALLGFQLTLSTAIALAVSAILLPFGQIGQVTALMVMSLPLTAVRAPAVILLERQLRYRPFAIVEFAETICYYGLAIGLVIAGWGVWGLAIAAVCRPLTGSILLLWLTPVARMAPSLSLAKVRPLLAFGFRYQAVGVVNLLRDQGINATLAILGGVSALGVWSLAYRILQIPLLLFTSLYRVSYPGMARLVEAREDVGKTMGRVVEVVAVFAGVILAPLVAAAPAWVPILFGHQWAGVVPVIPPASLHIMVFGPISVALVGYLWAEGEASAVLRASLVGTPLLFAALIPLFMLVGISAVGFGWIAAGIGEATVLILAARKHAEFSITHGLIRPTVVAVGAATVGWLLASTVGVAIVGGLLGAFFAAAAYLGALWLWQRSSLLDTLHLSLRGMRHAFARSG